MRGYPVGMTDPHIVRDGDAPTPFTAEEIRAATPRGLTIDGRSVDADGIETPWRRTYVEVDAAGSVSEWVELDDHGNPVGEPERDAASWAQLQAHASFPAAAVTIGRERIETPLGTLDCSRYEVGRPGGPLVFWFADAHPGMPIRYGRPRGEGWEALTEVLAIRVLPLG